jgi:TfoX/Sxy family transcriptional regulator of competence genes
MEWRKSPQHLIETFNSVVPGPPVVPRKMFGYPAAFVNGNLFMSLFQDRMVLRLSELDRTELLKHQDARVLEVMPGRSMREYIMLPAELVRDQERLRRWIAKALAYGSSLKVKTTRPKSGSTMHAKKAKSVGKTKKR